VSASDVKDAVEQPVKQSAEQSSSKNGATVKLAKFDGNDYGAHWGTYNNTKAFFDYKNNLFAQQAKGVIDVSSWQGDIDWAKAKADGVEGAIIRLGFGWDNDADAKAQRNIAECKRLGIPFGIYWYSYAEDVDGAKHEGNDVVSKLRQMGVSPSDLKYPVYYDLERWTWTGHTPPTNPNVYNGIVNAWYGALQSGGYQNLGVYSYTSYLQGPLNNANIYAKTRWVAQYGARIEFTAFGTNDRGWQYTESGQINGISGSVDMSAFGNKEFESSIDLTWIVRSEDIAVGAAVKDVTRALEYKWMSYDVNADRWKTISDWSTSNWAGWSDNEGTYWLHCEVRDIYSKKEIGEQTIAFAYAPGYRRINGTYAGYEGNGILLGVNSNNPKGKYEIKIYDTQKKTWVAGWNGQWAHWYPRKGIYWTHFELYTSDGFLTETKTYAFGV